MNEEKRIFSPSNFRQKNSELNERPSFHFRTAEEKKSVPAMNNGSFEKGFQPLYSQPPSAFASCVRLPASVLFKRSYSCSPQKKWYGRVSFIFLRSFITSVNVASAFCSSKKICCYERSRRTKKTVAEKRISFSSIHSIPHTHMYIQWPLLKLANLGTRLKYLY